MVHKTSTRSKTEIVKIQNVLYKIVYKISFFVLLSKARVYTQRCIKSSYCSP